MSSSSSEDAKKKQQEEELDFGDTNDLKAIAALEQPPVKSKTSEFPVPSIGSGSDAAHTNDRQPLLETLRDERPIAVTPPDEHYEVVPEDSATTNVSGQEDFWAESEQMFPGALGNKISVKLDVDVYDWFRAKGDNWEEEVNELLRNHIRSNS